jgi:hypothetical protein
LQNSRIEVQNVCKVVSDISKFCTSALRRRNCDIETPNGEDLDINATTQRDFSLFLSLWL